MILNVGDTVLVEVVIQAPKNDNDDYWGMLTERGTGIYFREGDVRVVTERPLPIEPVNVGAVVAVDKNMYRRTVRGDWQALNDANQTYGWAALVDMARQQNTTIKVFSVDKVLEV